MNRTFYCTVGSPLGPLTLTWQANALTGLFFEGAKALSAKREWVADEAPFSTVRAELAAYFRGEPTAFGVPLAPPGTPFQREVWNALRSIPQGETLTYGALAQRLGNPAAVRAVGAANGRNPIAIIVPCHRVVGAAGALVGFAGGLPRKRWLLEHEAARPQASLFPSLAPGHGAHQSVGSSR